MGRGNAVEKAAQAKARIEASSKAQAEIAQKAVEALDNGADPELVATLATEAAKSIAVEAVLTPVLADQQQQFIAENQRKEHLSRYSQEKMLKIRVSWELKEPWEIIGATTDGVQFVALFNVDGIAEVPQSVAEYLVTPVSDFSYVEE